MWVKLSAQEHHPLGTIQRSHMGNALAICCSTSKSVTAYSLAASCTTFIRLSTTVGAKSSENSSTERTRGSRKAPCQVLPSVAHPPIAAQLDGQVWLSVLGTPSERGRYPECEAEVGGDVLSPSTIDRPSGTNEMPSRAMQCRGSQRGKPSHLTSPAMIGSGFARARSRGFVPRHLGRASSRSRRSAIEVRTAGKEPYAVVTLLV